MCEKGVLTLSILISERIGAIPEDLEDGYKPFLASQEGSRLPSYSINEVIESIGSGFMPDKGAVADLGAGVIAGFDLVSLEYADNDRLYLAPTFRSAVDKRTGQMIGQGALTMMDSAANVKLLGIVTDPDRLPLKKDRRCIKIGDLSIRRFGIDAPSYRLRGIQEAHLIAEKPVFRSRGIEFSW